MFCRLTSKNVLAERPRTDHIATLQEFLTDPSTACRGQAAVTLKTRVLAFHYNTVKMRNYTRVAGRGPLRREVTIAELQANFDRSPFISFLGLKVVEADPAREQGMQGRGEATGRAAATAKLTPRECGPADMPARDTARQARHARRHLLFLRKQLGRRLKLIL